MAALRTKVFFCSFVIAVLNLIIWANIGCGPPVVDSIPKVNPVPEIYLVRDTPDSYYFQWTESLKERRVVLVMTTGKDYEESNGLHIYSDLKYEYLVFNPGDFRSDVFFADHIVSVAILPAREGFQPYKVVAPSHINFLDIESW